MNYSHKAAHFPFIAEQSENVCSTVYEHEAQKIDQIPNGL